MSRHWRQACCKVQHLLSLLLLLPLLQLPPPLTAAFLLLLHLLVLLWPLAPQHLMYQALLYLAHLLLPDVGVSARFARREKATTPKHAHTVTIRSTHKLEGNMSGGYSTRASTKGPSVRVSPTLPPNQGMLGNLYLQQVKELQALLLKPLLPRSAYPLRVHFCWGGSLVTRWPESECACPRHDFVLAECQHHTARV